MKKYLLLPSLLLLGTVVSQAQWLPEVRLTNDAEESQTSLNHAWCIASSGNVLHVVWRDERDGNPEIYYKRSTDGGASWGTDTRLSNDSAFSQHPSISVSGSDVHVVWQDNRDVNAEIYYKHSPDGGLSWEADTRLTNNTANSQYPSVSLSGSVVHVGWHDYRDGNWEIYYKRSTDLGVSWGADTRLTNNTSISQVTSIPVSDSVVHVIWYDNRDGNTEIYHKRSPDAGTSWGTDTRLTNNSASSLYHSASVSGSDVHVVWDDERDGNWEIYYKRSTDGGVNWSADTPLTNNTANSQYPSVSVSDSVVHVLWCDDRDGNEEIYYKRSTDGGVSWAADTRLTNDSAFSRYPSAAVSGSVVHVVWYDFRDGNTEIYYKRDTTDNSVGIDEFFLNENALQLYPNPFTNEISVNSSNNELYEILIYNITSSKLLQQQFTNAVTLNTSQLAKGIYIYEVRSKKALLKRGKIVKN